MKKSKCTGCFFLAYSPTTPMCMVRNCESIYLVEDCKAQVPKKKIKRVVLKKISPYGLNKEGLNTFEVYTEEGVKITSIESTKDIKCVLIVMDENLNVEQSFFLTDRVYLQMGDAGDAILFDSDKCYIGYLNGRK